MPFVFAVWAVRKSLPSDSKHELSSIIEHSLSSAEGHIGEIGELHGKEIGLSRNDVEEYLEGFNYRLGEREREAMREFRALVEEVQKELQS